MGSNNWIVDILQKALGTWSYFLRLIWDLLTTSPADFKGGTIWEIMVNIHEGIKGIAYGLLVLFFVVGVARTTTNFSEIKRPEQDYAHSPYQAEYEIGEVVYDLDRVVTLRERGDSRAEHEHRRAQNRKDPFGLFVKMHYQWLPPYYLIVRLHLLRRYPR